MTEGLFNQDFFREFFPKADGDSNLMLICGTNDMNKAAKEYAKGCDYSADNIFTF